MIVEPIELQEDFIENADPGDIRKRFTNAFVWLKDNSHLVNFAAISIAAILTFLNVTTYKKESSGADDVTVVDDSGVSEAKQDSILRDIRVDVSGAVNKPGVYSLSESSRFVDAMNRAGGMSEDASFDYISKTLNLSKKLEDGEKIYVPFEWDTKAEIVEGLTIAGVSDLKNEDSLPLTESKYNSETSNDKQSISSDVPDQKSTPSIQPASIEKININTASKEELMTLKGIGDVYSERIILNRPYQDLDELADKTEISSKTLTGFSSQITF